MDRKRDGLVSIGGIVSDLGDGPLKAFQGLKACTLSATISRPLRPAFDEPAHNLPVTGSYTTQRRYGQRR